MITFIDNRPQQKSNGTVNDFGANFGANFGVNVTQLKILGIMAANPGAKIQERADTVGLTKRNVEYAVRALKKATEDHHAATLLFHHHRLPKPR